MEGIEIVSTLVVMLRTERRLRDRGSLGARALAPFQIIAKLHETITSPLD